MAIVPDTKDWAWGLQRPCRERGLAAAVAPQQVAHRVRSNAEAWSQVLQCAVRDRPAPDVRSPLEYACRVRDVLRVCDERLVLMLTQDDPLYPS